MFLWEDDAATATTAEMFRPPLPPSMSAEGRRDHPRATSLLLCVPEGRFYSFTIEYILSLAYGDRSDGNGLGKGEGGGGETAAAAGTYCPSSETAFLGS